MQQSPVCPRLPGWLLPQVVKGSPLPSVQALGGAEESGHAGDTEAFGNLEAEFRDSPSSAATPTLDDGENYGEVRGPRGPEYSTVERTFMLHMANQI